MKEVGFGLQCTQKSEPASFELVQDFVLNKANALFLRCSHRPVYFENILGATPHFSEFEKDLGGHIQIPRLPRNICNLEVMLGTL